MTSPSAQVALGNGYATPRSALMWDLTRIELWWDETRKPSKAPYVGAETKLSSMGWPCFHLHAALGLGSPQLLTLLKSVQHVSRRHYAFERTGLSTLT